MWLASLYDYLEPFSQTKLYILPSPFLAEFNIDIHIVFTFQIIFFPFVHMSFASLLNSKCPLSEWAKKNVIFVVDFQGD